MSKFSGKLVLAQWALNQLGIEDFSRLSELLRAPEHEGWAADGSSRFLSQLTSYLPSLGSHGRTVSDDQLRSYDNNIVSHWKHITRRRNLSGSTLYPLYFQYLGLLLTELYLDRYFGDAGALLSSANARLASVNEQLNARNQIEAFKLGDLNKAAFWMATGSGKTLLMHCHIRQYLYYLGKAGRRHELNRIILLTPNEGLSRQHKEEFELSGIEAEYYDKDGATLFTGRGVDIIDIHKLRETSGEKTVAVETFEGNNLVLVDEGHRGSGGEDWLDKRARLCASGFSFEYSATFGQAVKAASGAKQKALTQMYAKCILVDYSYKYFYDDGYGKDFNILNLADEHEDETRPLYLTACLLSFYQQCRRFADGGPTLAPYLLESPLMVFVGGSVTGQRQVQEDTDLVLILKFLASFIANRSESERRIKRLLERRDGLIAGGQRIFDRFFPYLEHLYPPTKAAELFEDVLKHVFNAPGGGQLHIVHLQGSEGEIGLRVGENPWFGVVNVGDSKQLCDLCADRRGPDEHFQVDELKFSGSLFEDIRRPGSAIRVLAGAKKFTEGWSSWRVSAMGLMNVGKKEGSEIIQLFGRGVRLKGFKFKLKRTSALDPLDLQSADLPEKHPDYIQLLETLNIFGIRSDYMKEFEEYLEEEGVGNDDRREIIFLPTVRLPEFERSELKLHVVRPKAEMPDFKKSVRLKLASLEGRLDGKVIADWYPRLQKHSSVNGREGGVSVLNRDTLKAEQVAFLSWDAIWFELERHKRESAYYNLLFGPADLRSLLSQTWWYELFIPPGYLDFRGLDRRALWQDIAVHLLKGYSDRFYQFHKRDFEAPYLEYQVLKPGDDLILKEYQVLVKRSERQLIQRLRTLSDKLKDGEFEELNLENLAIFHASRHLYRPLIHLSHGEGRDSLIKVVPTHLNEGEKVFVDDLETFCKAESNGMLSETELYLLRNHSSDKAISFFTEVGFRPDFILWLLKGDQQTIAFLDPKGMRNFTDGFNNPKVQFYRRVKDLEASLKRPEIRLESFLLSQTARHDLRWPSPTSPTTQATASDYRQHHILCAKDDAPGYVRDLIGMLQTK
jgi:hypothetical protein